MFRFIFRIIPWWLFALLAFTFAPLSLEFFEEYQRDAGQLEQALAAGPPDAIAVSQLDQRAATAPFGEVQLDGVLRADLGVQTIYFSETQYTFVGLDGAAAGPLVVLLMPTSEAEQSLTALVNAADSSGRVTVQGLLAPTRVGDISRRLARDSGISREIFVVEPFFGTRSSVLADQVSDSRIMLFIGAAFTAFFGLMAFWRFRQWRIRRSPATQSQKSAKQVKAERMAKQQANTGQPNTGASPWGSFQPQPRSGTKPQMVKPQTTPQSARQAPQKAKPPAEPELATNAVPDFKSVFPGGGSSFRYKSADQIIQQSFGTLSGFKSSKPTQ